MMRKEMYRHVMDLLERYNIIYSGCRRPTEARTVFYTAAGEEFHEVWITPIRSAISYATALHEIGHILGRHQRSPDTLVRERWAWRWAKENALIWTPAMEKHCSVSLAWYEARRER
jgi:antirestriction protein ArdC